LSSNKESQGKIMAQHLNRKQQSGLTAIEYGLIAAGISLAIIAVVQALGGTNLNSIFQFVSTVVR
jgi:pilus assembly protein Flp/PilA